MSIYNTALKRIAAVNDISGLGKCSLTVALPVISASGVECSCIPTALLSTHTGEFTGWTKRDLSGDMLPIARHWHSVGASFDGVYSGYLASPEQALELERVIDTIADRRTLIIVDPAMADNGEYYSGFDERMCAAFRRLCLRADVITPNITEAALLSGLPYRPGPHSDEYIDALMEGLGYICGGIIAMTGVHMSDGQIGVVAMDTRTGDSCVCTRPAAPGVFYGTGDIFASALAALLVRGAGMRDAAETAISLVYESIQRTVRRGTPRRFGVDFEGALGKYIRRVDEIFG